METLRGRPHMVLFHWICMVHSPTGTAGHILAIPETSLDDGSLASWKPSCLKLVTKKSWPAMATTNDPL